MKKAKELKSAHWSLHNSNGGINYSTGNIVNSIVITMPDARWVLEISEGHFVKYVIVQPLCCTPESNAK